LAKQFFGAKVACKMLMKLTAGVNFINLFCAHFSYESYVLAAFSSYMYVEKAAETNFHTKNTHI
jgi:hypothetical protein